MHRNLDKQAIGPESPFYVHFEELPGDVLGQDPVPRLATSVRRSTAGSALGDTAQADALSGRARQLTAKLDLAAEED